MATETVTVVFTDLVGSTALLSEVGEVAAETLRREHFALLREAIAPSGGTEVKNLGDGLMVVFSSAADAVAAAVAMQRAFEHRNRRADQPLAIRVGISLGDADVDEGDYFGVPVIEAARLCARADGGEILAADVVRMLAGSRGGFTFDLLGALELKGLDQPVATCRIAWEPVASEAQPSLPARLQSSVAPTFVGRAEERERLSTAWKAASSDGERRLVLLSGEPGIGKTTLSASFARQVHDEGATVLYGRCDEDLGIPYQPWIEALTQLVAHAPDEVLTEHVTARGTHLARLVPELASRTGAEPPVLVDGDSERFALFGGVADLLTRISRDEPLLVVLDDLHWADQASVQLLRHVATAEGPTRLVVLGTFRDSDVTTDHPIAALLAALHREQGVERITLRGLSDADLLALLEEIAGHEMNDDGMALRDAVLAETAGNPFFVGEILRHLADTGAIYQGDDGQWVAAADLRTMGLPVSVKEVVGRRLAGLGADTERVLALAAVIGRDFDVPLLSAAANTDEDAVIDLCDAAVAAAVLQTTDDPDRYTFAHALIEHALYDGLSPARRARAHRAIAEQLEAIEGASRGQRAGELAHHWAAAVQPTDAAKAIHYAELAAAHALEQLAPDEALRWYTQALELLDRTPDPDGRRRAEILLGVGIAQRLWGVAAHRETLLEAAQLADDIDAVDLLVQATLANSRGWSSIIGELDHERVALIDRALDRLDDPNSADRARLLCLAAIEQYYSADLDERLALVQEAIAVARRSGAVDALTFALLRAAVATRSPATLVPRTAWLTEHQSLLAGSTDLADYSTHGEQILSSHGEHMLTAIEHGDRARVDEEWAAIQAISDLTPQAQTRWVNSFHEGMLAMIRGDLSDAERSIELALARGAEAGQPDAMTVYSGQLVNLRHHQGRLGEMVPLIEQAVADSPALHAYRAVFAMAVGRSTQTARAVRLLDDAAVDGFALPYDSAWTTGAASWADVAYQVGDRGAAQTLHDLMAPFHDQIVTTGITLMPAMSHFLGQLDHLLGRLDDADAWFTEAMAQHEAFEAPLLVAYTEAAWAALLADRRVGDDLERARELADRAVAAARAGGYGYIEADATAVLDRLAD